MYVPSHFAETRLEVLHDLIRAQPLATLVTLEDGGLVANHIPLELDPAIGPHGALRGHVARGNSLWKAHRAELDALAIFQGPHGYITPSYYATTAATGEVVPTWNYVTVHAYGPLQVKDDPVWLRRFVEQLTERHEATTGEPPWRIGDAPERFVERVIKAIVGIEIPIARIEGKWKVSQNRTAEDRAGVVAGLRRTSDPVLHAVADLVSERG
jgi:transcriptional regulator